MIGGLNKIGGIMNYINILGFYSFTSSDWFLTLIMKGLFALDRCIYFLVEKIYIAFNFLCNLNLSVLSDLFGPLINRVYSLVGVVLLFTLALNILRTIVNPDDASSIVKDPKKFGIDIFTTLALLMITIPISGNRGIIFKYLDIIEDVFLPSSNDADNGIIMRFLFGEGSVSIVGSGSETFGRQMAKTILMQFVVLDDQYGATTGEKYNNIKNCADDSCDYGGLSDLLGKKEIAYFPFVSGAVGFYVLYSLITHCFWAVRRCFELAVLECVAPIFVLMRYSVKTRDKWNWFLNTFKKSYLKLFCLMTSFYLNIMLINNLLVFLAKNLSGDSSVSIETTGSASSSLLAMKVNAENTLVSNAPTGFFAKTVYMLILLVGIVNLSLKLPNIINEVLGLQADDGKDDSFGAFLGKIAGLGKTVGKAAISRGASLLDEKTGGKFGDFIVEKGRDIKRKIDEAKDPYLGIKNRYAERKKLEHQAKREAERIELLNTIRKSGGGGGGTPTIINNTAVVFPVIGQNAQSIGQPSDNQTRELPQGGSYRSGNYGGDVIEGSFTEVSSNASNTRQNMAGPEKVTFALPPGDSNNYQSVHSANINIEKTNEIIKNVTDAAQTETLSNSSQMNNTDYHQKEIIKVIEKSKAIDVQSDMTQKSKNKDLENDIKHKKTIDDSPNLMADSQSKQEVRNIYNNKENI